MKTLNQVIAEGLTKPSVICGMHYMYNNVAHKVKNMDIPFVTIINSETGEEITVNQSELGNQVSEAVKFKACTNEAKTAKDDDKKEDKKDKKKPKDGDNEESADDNYDGKNNDAYDDAGKDKDSEKEKEKEVDESIVNESQFDPAKYNEANALKRAQILANFLKFTFKKINLENIDGYDAIFVHSKNDAVSLKKAKENITALGIRDVLFDVDVDGKFTLVVGLDE